MQASQEGHVDVVNVLLDHGAKVNYWTDVSYVYTFCVYIAVISYHRPKKGSGVL